MFATEVSNLITKMCTRTIFHFDIRSLVKRLPMQYTTILYQISVTAVKHKPTLQIEHLLLTFQSLPIFLHALLYQFHCCYGGSPSHTTHLLAASLPLQVTLRHVCVTTDAVEKQ